MNVGKDALVDLDDIYPKLYDTSKMLDYFRNEFFATSVECFQEDDCAKHMFSCDYEEMQVKLNTISDMLVDTRIKIELALGMKTTAADCKVERETKLFESYKRSVAV